MALIKAAEPIRLTDNPTVFRFYSSFVVLIVLVGLFMVLKSVLEILEGSFSVHWLVITAWSPLRGWGVIQKVWMTYLKTIVAW